MKYKEIQAIPCEMYGSWDRIRKMDIIIERN